MNPIAAGDTAANIDRLLAVGPQGAGSTEAAAAWAEVAKLDVDSLPTLLSAVDRAGPLAANWIRTAIDAIVERAKTAGRPLPAAAMEAFFKDRTHAPRGRRLAYELLLQVEPSARGRLEPTLLDDPSVELRRDAVAAKIAEAAADVAKSKTDAAAKARAVALLRRVFHAARDHDQIDQLAASLRGLGETVDLAAHLGYVMRWKLIGPLDNTGDRGWAPALPPEREQRFDAVYPGKNRHARWVDYTSTAPNGVVDFNKTFGEQKGVLGYAHTVFVVAEARKAEIRMQTGNAFVLWVNGRKVAEFHSYHSGGQPDQYIVPIELRAGDNAFLLKICQNEEVQEWTKSWDFQLRVCDSTGGAILPAKLDRRTTFPGRPVAPEGATYTVSATNNVETVGWVERSESHHAPKETPPSNLRFPGRPVAPEGATYTVSATKGCTTVDLTVPCLGEATAHANASTSATTARDWRHFRGSGSTSSSSQSLAGARLGDKAALAWKAPLPGIGAAGPIVVGPRIFVTAASGTRLDRLHVMAVDAASGKTLWQRQLWATGSTACHPWDGVAGSTPGSDGRRIVAQFSSGDVACFDLDGRLLWLRGLNYESPTSRNDVGMASSPLVVDGVAIVQIECPGPSFVCGMDMDSGRTLWKLARDPAASWTSPALLPRQGAAPLALVQSRGRIDCVEPRSGRIVWTLTGSVSTISSPTGAGKLALVPLRGLTAVDALAPVAAGAEPKVVWEQPRLGCDNVSPVVSDGRIYTIRGGVVTCGELSDGKVLWQARLPAPANQSGAIWATPVVAGQHLIAVNQRGLVWALSLARPQKVVATTTIDDGVLASPAVSGDAVYFRTNAFLWKFHPK